MFGVPIWAVDGGSGRLAIVLCPSDEADDTQSINTDLLGNQLRYSQLSYGINTGVPDNLSMTSPQFGLDWPANGVIECKLKGSTTSAPEANLKNNFKTTMADLVNGDGSTNTLLLADNGDLEEWNNAPSEYNVGIVWDDNYQNSSSPNQLLNKFLPYPNTPPNTKPNMTLQSLATSNNAVGSPQVDALAFARPRSNHPGGFMAAFCDGRTQFISESVAYLVYAKLMTSSGKKYAAAGMAPNAPAYSNLRQLLSAPVVSGDY